MIDEPKKLIASWAYDALKQATALFDTLTAETRHGAQSIKDVLEASADNAAWSRFIAIRDNYAEKDAPMRAKLMQAIKQTDDPEKKRELVRQWRLRCCVRRDSAIKAAAHRGYASRIFYWRTRRRAVSRWTVYFASDQYVLDFIERLSQIRDACAASASERRGPGRLPKAEEWKIKNTPLQVRLAEIDLDRYRSLYETLGRIPEDSEYSPLLPKQLADQLGATERGVLEARQSAGYQDAFDKGVQGVYTHELGKRLERRDLLDAEERRRHQVLVSTTAEQSRNNK